VASGAGDIAFDFGLKPWDIGPIPILIEEAGGKWGNRSGSPALGEDHIIVSNPHLFSTVMDLLNSPPEDTLL
jgi:histidinol-phosphatase